MTIFVCSLDVIYVLASHHSRQCIWVSEWKNLDALFKSLWISTVWQIHV